MVFGSCVAMKQLLCPLLAAQFVAQNDQNSNCDCYFCRHKCKSIMFDSCTPYYLLKMHKYIVYYSKYPNIPINFNVLFYDESSVILLMARKTQCNAVALQQ